MQEIVSLDIGKLPIKDSQIQMSFPFFVMSKNPVLETRTYEDENGNELRIMPHQELGQPTQQDKHLLIFLLSICMQKINDEKTIPNKVRITSADFLDFCGKGTGGSQYSMVGKSLSRLTGANVEAIYKEGSQTIKEEFHILDHNRVVRANDADGRLIHFDVTLSPWLLNVLEKKKVLTLHPDYFTLSRPLEQRLYEIARKYCGKQKSAGMTIDKLHELTGSTASRKVFMRNLRQIIKTNTIDYQFRIKKTGNKQTIFISPVPHTTSKPKTKPKPKTTAKKTKAVQTKTKKTRAKSAPKPTVKKAMAGQEIRNYQPSTELIATLEKLYEIEIKPVLTEFREWVMRKNLSVKDTDAMFRAFVQRRQDNKDQPKTTTTSNRFQGTETPSWKREFATIWWSSITAPGKDTIRKHIQRQLDPDTSISDDSVALRYLEGLNKPPDPLPAHITVALSKYHKLGHHEKFENWQGDWDEDLHWLFYLTHRWIPA